MGRKINLSFIWLLGPRAWRSSTCAKLFAFRGKLQPGVDRAKSNGNDTPLMDMTRQRIHGVQQYVHYRTLNATAGPNLVSSFADLRHREVRVTLAFWYLILDCRINQLRVCYMAPSRGSLSNKLPHKHMHTIISTASCICMKRRSVKNAYSTSSV
jgi:hypothetical protein